MMSTLELVLSGLLWLYFLLFFFTESTTAGSIPGSKDVSGAMPDGSTHICCYSE